MAALSALAENPIDGKIDEVKELTQDSRLNNFPISYIGDNIASVALPSVATSWRDRASPLRFSG